MREIKFRAWCQGEMINDVYLIGSDVIDSGSYELQHREDGIFTPSAVMQFTGLKDKEGIEIYEGDIVKSDNFSSSEVRFYDGSFYFGDLPVADRDFYADEGDRGWIVIGNVYKD